MWWWPPSKNSASGELVALELVLVVAVVVGVVVQYHFGLRWAILVAYGPLGVYLAIKFVGIFVRAIRKIRRR